MIIYEIIIFKDLIIKLIWILLGIQVQTTSKYNSRPKKNAQKESKVCKKMKLDEALRNANWQLGNANRHFRSVNWHRF